MRNTRNAVAALKDALDLDKSQPATTNGKARKAAQDMMGRQLHAAAANVVALYAAYAFSEDEAARNEARASESAKAFDSAGNYLSPPEASALLDLRTVERTLAEARTAIQEAIDLDMRAEFLKAEARALLEHAERVKLNLARVEKVDVPVEVPLVLLCHQRGLPYRIAPRVLALNTGMDPNFMKGEVLVHAS